MDANFQIDKTGSFIGVIGASLRDLIETDLDLVLVPNRQHASNEYILLDWQLVSFVELLGVNLLDPIQWVTRANAAVISIEDYRDETGSVLLGSVMDWD